jgi:hypothetical protein
MITSAVPMPAGFPGADRATRIARWPCRRPPAAASPGGTTRGTTAAMDDRIRQGRNPHWRLAFEDQLGADARTRIRQAVKRGQSVADPEEAAVAAGLARRERRTVLLHARLFLPFQVVVASVWLAWMLTPQRRLPVGFLWFWAAAWVALVGGAPFVLWRRFRIARRAADTNDQVADQAHDPSQ